MQNKDWGKGIPSYNESDLMSDEELIRFAMDIVAKYELNGNGYELVDWSCQPNVFPNIVLKKDEKLIFVELTRIFTTPFIIITPIRVICKRLPQLKGEKIC